MSYNYGNKECYNDQEYWVRDHCCQRKESLEKKDCNRNTDKNLDNQNCNHLNVYLNDKNTENKQCKHEEKEYGCCCDITKLEEILCIFKRNHSKVWIFTHNTCIPYYYEGINAGYIRDIKNDLVYFTLGDCNNETLYVIPICNIIWVLAENCEDEDDKKIEQIMKTYTLEKEKDCCCSCQIEDAIKERFDYFGPFLPWFGVQLKDDGLTGLYAWFLWYCVLPYIQNPKIELLTNCDLILETLCIPHHHKVYYSIIPNCAIDTISTIRDSAPIDGVPSPVSADNLSIPTNMIMSEDMRNIFEKMIQDVKSKSPQ